MVPIYNRFQFIVEQYRAAYSRGVLVIRYILRTYSLFPFLNFQVCPAHICWQPGPDIIGTCICQCFPVHKGLQSPSLFPWVLWSPYLLVLYFCLYSDSARDYYSIQYSISIFSSAHKSLLTTEWIIQ
jgi:hypothetical protein